MKLLFISLGCDKNLVDTEEMIRLLEPQGYELIDDAAEAEIIIVNTCCFIDEAKEESISVLLEMANYKELGTCKALLVTGCLAQRYREEIFKEIPEVDAVLGTTAYEKIVPAIEKVLNGERCMEIEALDYLPEPAVDGIIHSDGHFAYLKIAEGCDKHCTYCIIPKVRGPYRSVPMEKLVARAQTLADQGVKELILVAQETTMYGVDLYGYKCLHLLVEALCKITEIRWIRILYCYPEEIYEELSGVMQREEQGCHYLDLPIPPASDAVLRRMGRRTTRADLMAIIQNLRERIPDIVLRTTLITGFPGETEENHREMMEFVDQMEFEHLGVFTYSQEEGTPAASMPDQIDAEVMADWRDDLMALQQEIAFAHGENKVDTIVTAMIDEVLADEDEDGEKQEEQEEQEKASNSGIHAYIGRTAGDAPEVDGEVYIESVKLLNPGDLVRVKITGTDEYDLIGEVVDESAE
ncbi:MAG: 30S ribosomal protein S12 methylthiotransferase RimO [Lachnospiraceae bacterium]|nr:30S ribosomal protein S12 methylthiotransferase RimO [Lachnospiraceae bacterium]